MQQTHDRPGRPALADLPKSGQATQTPLDHLTNVLEQRTQHDHQAELRRKPCKVMKARSCRWYQHCVPNQQHDIGAMWFSAGPEAWGRGAQVLNTSGDWKGVIQSALNGWNDVLSFFFLFSGAAEAVSFQARPRRKMRRRSSVATMAFSC